MSPKKPFSKDIILLDDVETAVGKIVNKMQEVVLHKLKRNGGVIGASGGIDSSICLNIKLRL